MSNASRSPEMPAFQEVWNQILRLEGEEFVTIGQLPFTYKIERNGLYPSRTKYRISRGNVEKAFGLVPIANPGAISQTIRGPSYMWAILQDPRISLGRW